VYVFNTNVLRRLSESPILSGSEKDLGLHLCKTIGLIVESLCGMCATSPDSRCPISPTPFAACALSTDQSCATPGPRARYCREIVDDACCRSAQCTPSWWKAVFPWQCTPWPAHPTLCGPRRRSPCRYPSFFPRAGILGYPTTRKVLEGSRRRGKVGDKQTARRAPPPRAGRPP